MKHRHTKPRRWSGPGTHSPFQQPDLEPGCIHLILTRFAASPTPSFERHLRTGITQGKRSNRFKLMPHLAAPSVHRPPTQYPLVVGRVHPWLQEALPSRGPCVAFTNRILAPAKGFEPTCSGVYSHMKHEHPARQHMLKTAAAPTSQTAPKGRLGVPGRSRVGPGFATLNMSWDVSRGPGSVPGLSRVFPLLVAR